MTTTTASTPSEGAPRLRLHDLAQALENTAYDLAGQLESLTVARLILMSHEVSQIAEQLEHVD